MSTGFFPDDSRRVASNLQPSLVRDPGFMSLAGRYLMQGFAKTASAIDILGAVGPMVQDAINGGTEAQDQYFQEHDDVWARAVDYWTPSPTEVMAAGKTVNTLAELSGAMAGFLPQAIISAPVAATMLLPGTAEELTRQNVPTVKALGAGAATAAGTAVGMAIPAVGKTIATKVATGAAGNVGQGVVTRAAVGQILEGTPAEKRPGAFDAASVIIDAAMGAGFGVVSFIGDKPVNPSDVDAALVLKQAKHLEQDTLPGKPVDTVSQTAHVNSVKKAIDDVLNDRPVNVGKELENAAFEPDPTKIHEANDIRDEFLNVYHGSPYEFEQFDLSKIGTGEGAQAYGHGLYFAEKKDTAEFYSTKHPRMPDGKYVVDKVGDQFVLRDFWGVIDESDYFHTREAAEKAAGSDLFKPTKSLYKVQISKQVIDKMLDWDKPLSEQSESIKKLIGNLDDEINSGKPIPRNNTVGTALSYLENKLGSTLAVSKWFSEKGITGIRYLDQGSRIVGEGTRNFVLFNPEHATIIERNGRRLIPRGEDRRQNIELRQKYESMTPEERGVAIESLHQKAYTDQLTGLRNRYAYEEDPRLPFQVHFDADSLKWVNDNMGHDAGDRMLQAIGRVIQDEAQNGYRGGDRGDEFIVQAATREEAQAVAKKISDRLSQMNVYGETPKGIKVAQKGIGISFGIGETPAAAEKGLSVHKAAKEKAGLRAARGEEPKYIEYENVELLRAQDIVKNQDITVSYGVDENGQPIMRKMSDILNESTKAVEDAQADESIFKIAAGCLFGKL